MAMSEKEEREMCPTNTRTYFKVLVKKIGHLCGKILNNVRE